MFLGDIKESEIKEVWIGMQREKCWVELPEICLTVTSAAPAEKFHMAPVASGFRINVLIAFCMHSFITIP